MMSMICLCICIFSSKYSFFRHVLKCKKCILVHETVYHILFSNFIIDSNIDTENVIGTAAMLLEIGFPPYYPRLKTKCIEWIELMYNKSFVQGDYVPKIPARMIQCHCCPRLVRQFYCHRLLVIFFCLCQNPTAR